MMKKGSRFRGPVRAKELENLCIVMANYNDFKEGVLSEVDWHRIVFDEGHAIKNRHSNTFKNALKLKARCRWIMTGTPYINSLDDIYSYLLFLRVDGPKNIREFHKLYAGNPEDLSSQIICHFSLRRDYIYRELGRKCAADMPIKTMCKLKASIVSSGTYAVMLTRTRFVKIL
jgi:DNA repair protein RAD5